MNKKIGIDIDDVILDFAGAFLEYFNREVGTNYVRSDLTGFYDNLSITVPAYYGKSMRQMFDEFPLSEEFKDMPFIPGALPAIQYLTENYDVSFITARQITESQDHVYNTWSANELPMDKIYFRRDKGVMVKQLGVDVMIDDADHNLERIINTVPTTRVLLFNQPWNQSAPYERVSGWPELLEELSK